MDATSIALDREAYDLLRRQKRPGETFSQVVKRLAGASQPLSSFVGAWKGLPARTLKEIERERRRMRELDDERFQQLFGGSS